MILPTTSASALLLLIVSLVCLGSWVNTFKLTGTKWRFELFYFDFTIGAVLLSVLAAYTLGTLGSELAFTDRMLVAGRAAQAFVVAAGFIFNLGNMLLLAAVSLIGVAGAFSLSIGLALVVGSFFYLQGANVPLWTLGLVLAIVAVALGAAACRMRDRSVPNAARVTKGNAAPRTQNRDRSRRTTKGLILAALAGIALGLFYPVGARGIPGDFGVGPYAAILLFSVGVLISTLIFNFYFLNIAIEGEPLKLAAYFRGKANHHLLGVAGGGIWAFGALAAVLAWSVPQQANADLALSVILPLASVLLVIFWGLVGWREFARAPSKAKTSLAFAAVFLAGAIVLLGLGTAR